MNLNFLQVNEDEPFWIEFFGLKRIAIHDRPTHLVQSVRNSYENLKQ